MISSCLEAEMHETFLAEFGIAEIEEYHDKYIEALPGALILLPKLAMLSSRQIGISLSI